MKSYLNFKVDVDNIQTYCFSQLIEEKILSECK